MNEYDCEKLTGRKRKICLGEVEVPNREEYLKRWFGPQKEKRTIAKPQKKTKQSTQQQNLKSRPPGVGTCLKRALEKKGIRAKSTCQCNHRAGEMDRKGIEWCEQNRETIVGWLKEGAMERVWLIPFAKLFPQPVEWAARKLLEDAIALAKGEVVPSVEVVEWEEPVKKNLIYHIWPVKDYGVWQWNLDRLLESIDLFNGKRIMAIAHDKSTDLPATVKRYLDGHGFEFIEVENDPRLREVKPFVDMLERVESLDPNEVTFSGHAKGVRHKISTENEGSTVIRWTEAMYRTVLENWEGAKEALKTYAMAGSFKRYGQFRTKGNHRWHYSGAFYWFRHRDVFSRDWRKIDKRFFGTESWPGHLFKPKETACLFMDNVGDLYDLNYWKRVVEPELEQYIGSLPA